MKKYTALTAGAIMMIASACTTTTTSEDASLSDAVEALQEEVDRLQAELDESEAPAEDSSSSDSSESSESSDSSSSESSSSSSSSSDSYLPQPLIDSNGTATDRETAEKIAEELGCEGSHEMDDRHMPCASHDEGSTVMNKYQEEISMPYPSDGLYDTMEEAEQAAEMAACEGHHEINGQYMPCDEHDEYVDNMEMIESVGPVQMTEDGMYPTEAEALAAAAAAGCTGTHQMGDMWMMCGEHSEGEQVAEEAVLVIQQIVAVAEDNDDTEDDAPIAVADGTQTVISDPLASLVIKEKKARTITVEARYDGKPLSSGKAGPQVCITHYNKYGNAVGCRPGSQVSYAKQLWNVTCQRGINGSPKPYYTIRILDGGNELARIDISEDSRYRC
ncbi:MAG: hypothetical protein ACO3HT_01715 [Ilumatobacteraceae bacterium]